MLLLELIEQAYCWSNLYDSDVNLLLLKLCFQFFLQGMLIFHNFVVTGVQNLATPPKNQLFNIWSDLKLYDLLQILSKHITETKKLQMMMMMKKFIWRLDQGVEQGPGTCLFKYVAINKWYFNKKSTFHVKNNYHKIGVFHFVEGLEGYHFFLISFREGIHIFYVFNSQR